MNNFNLLGRLVKDPIVNTSPNGTVYAFITIATYRDKEKTDFIDVTLFGKTAEHCQRHFSKGDYIGCTGDIDASGYKKDGDHVYGIRLIGRSIYFGGKKNTVPVQADSVSVSESDFMATAQADDNLPF